MSTCYEFALSCDLKADVSQEVIDTLKYMTRSSEYVFETTINHSLFTSSEDGGFRENEDGSSEEDLDYLADWKVIIENHPTGGQELLPGIFGSMFQDRKLGVRKFIGDDEFSNAFPLLLDWLVSICESTGFVGYYTVVRNMEILSDPILIYFFNGEVLEKQVEGKLIKFLSGEDY